MTQTFKQLSDDVMLLHQNTNYLMFATQQNSNNAPYIVLNNCYYIALPRKDAEIHNLHLAPQVAILLIENINKYQKTSLTWIVMARAMSLHESRYSMAFATLKQNVSKILLDNIEEICLCEFRPQQGKLLSYDGISYSLDGNDLQFIDKSIAA